MRVFSKHFLIKRYVHRAGDRQATYYLYLYFFACSSLMFVADRRFRGYYYTSSFEATVFGQDISKMILGIIVGSPNQRLLERKVN